MSMSVGSEDDEELSGEINVTPLVDVMLVMLIIFLITIPVVLNQIPVTLPKISNIPDITKPDHITISVRDDGTFFMGLESIPDRETLRQRLREKAVLVPQPEIHLRADKETRFENVGRVIVDVQRSGLVKVSFTTEPDAPTK